VAPVAQEIADRVAGLGDVLAKLGAKVSDTARPSFHPRDAHRTYVQHLNSIMGAGMPDEVFQRMRASADALDPEDDSDQAEVLRATVLSHRDWIRADHARERLRYAWRGFFDEWDVLICPQMATTAFRHDHSPFSSRTLAVDGRTRPYFEQLFWSGLVTASYLPSTVFPTGLSDEGLPIGLQAVGAEYDDLQTIDFVRLLAREIGGFEVPPGCA
jgi:amidase